MNVKQVLPFVGVVCNLSHPRHYGFMERVLGRAKTLVTQMGDDIPVVTP